MDLTAYNVSGMSAPTVQSPSLSLLHLLNTDQFEPLNTALTDLQRRFEQGDLREDALLNAFKAFSLGGTGFGPPLETLVQEHPGSYVAQVALATWLTARGYAERGGQTSDRVSDRGRRGMLHYLTGAREVAEAATVLCANPLVALMILADTQLAFGNPITPELLALGQLPDWYERGIALNPESLALRLRVLSLLRTEWGGSDEMATTYLRSQEPLLSNSARSRLWARYHAQVAHYARFFERNPDRAAENAAMAAQLHPAESAEPLIGAFQQGDDQAATGELVKVLDVFEAHPEYVLAPNAAIALGETLKTLPSQDERLERGLSLLLARSSAEASDAADCAYAVGRLALAKGVKVTGRVTPVLETLLGHGCREVALILAQLYGEVLKDPHQERATCLRGAQLYDPVCSWRVYRSFELYRSAFGLGARDHLLYLLRAADGGQNDARVELATALRAGQVELGDDNVLRPVDTQPLQASLEYAKWLLERADHEGQPQAKKLLKAARDRDWQAETAKRGKPAALSSSSRQPALAAPRRIPFGVVWLLGLALMAVIRACSGH